jgi:hypothetical protein
MSLHPATRARSAEPAPAWIPDAAIPEHAAHAGLLAGATVIGEAARHDLSIRIGLWLDDAGRVRRARWRASDRTMRSPAEAACAHLEAGGDPGRLPDVLCAAEQLDRCELVAAAVDAALTAAGARRSG